jgi:hypothetical protein
MTKYLGAPDHDTTFDLGGRCQFHKGRLLFMARRSFNANSSGQAESLAYTGIQILLDRTETRLHSEH